MRAGRRDPYFSPTYLSDTFLNRWDNRIAQDLENFILGDNPCVRKINRNDLGLKSADLGAKEAT